MTAVGGALWFGSRRDDEPALEPYESRSGLFTRTGERPLLAGRVTGVRQGVEVDDRSPLETNRPIVVNPGEVVGDPSAADANRSWTLDEITGDSLDSNMDFSAFARRHQAFNSSGDVPSSEGADRTGGGESSSSRRRERERRASPYPVYQTERNRRLEAWELFSKKDGRRLVDLALAYRDGTMTWDAVIHRVDAMTDTAQLRSAGLLVVRSRVRDGPVRSWKEVRFSPIDYREHRVEMTVMAALVAAREEVALPDVDAYLERWSDADLTRERAEVELSFASIRVERIEAQLRRQSDAPLPPTRDPGVDETGRDVPWADIEITERAEVGIFRMKRALDTSAEPRRRVDFATETEIPPGSINHYVGLLTDRHPEYELLWNRAMGRPDSTADAAWATEPANDQLVRLVRDAARTNRPLAVAQIVELDGRSKDQILKSLQRLSRDNAAFARDWRKVKRRYRQVHLNTESTFDDRVLEAVMTHGLTRKEMIDEWGVTPIVVSKSIKRLKEKHERFREVYERNRWSK